MKISKHNLRSKLNELGDRPMPEKLPGWVGPAIVASMLVAGLAGWWLATGQNPIAPGQRSPKDSVQSLHFPSP